MAWSESPSAEIGRDHIHYSTPYLWSMNQLAEAFGCEPTEEAVLQYHNDHWAQLGGRLLKEVGYTALVIDDGYPPPGEALSLEQMSALSGCPVAHIQRLESLQERLIGEARSFDDFLERYVYELQTMRERGIAGAKSIAAYRGGLDIGEPAQADALAAFHAAREAHQRSGSVRLVDKRLLDYTLRTALEELARQALPLQFHTGYGDPDEDLRLANPLHLRPLFEDGRYRGAPIVLLHESWPFYREAAYLTAMYPNAFMDLSFAIPFLGFGEMLQFTRTVLEAAPAGKVMTATDSWGLPEHYWLGAQRARTVLARALEAMVSDGMLRTAQAEDLAQMVLAGNARRLYGLA
jgi:predicted TIM-barrel fold metal-dependent hydrolase